jgi:hypothetical protein
LVPSAIVQSELVAAPPTVRRFFEELLGLAEVTDITTNALELRNAYPQAKIVTPKFADDALHVTRATVAGCALIVSWNFQHIVHFQKIPPVQRHQYAARLPADCDVLAAGGDPL